MRPLLKAGLLVLALVSLGRTRPMAARACCGHSAKCCLSPSAPASLLAQASPRVEAASALFFLPAPPRAAAPLALASSERVCSAFERGKPARGPPAA